MVELFYILEGGSNHIQGESHNHQHHSLSRHHPDTCRNTCYEVVGRYTQRTRHHQQASGNGRWGCERCAGQRFQSVPTRVSSLKRRAYIFVRNGQYISVFGLWLELDETAINITSFDGENTSTVFKGDHRLLWANLNNHTTIIKGKTQLELGGEENTIPCCWKKKGRGTRRGPFHS